MANSSRVDLHVCRFAHCFRLSKKKPREDISEPVERLMRKKLPPEISSLLEILSEPNNRKPDMGRQR